MTGYNSPVAPAAPKILVVVSDDTFRESLDQRCSSLGLEVVTVHDALDVLISMVEAPADLILVDADVAGVECLAVCEKIAVRQPPPKVPIIALTGRLDPASRERWDRIGALAIRKDLDTWQNLKDALNRLFGLAESGGAIAPPIADTPETALEEMAIEEAVTPEAVSSQSVDQTPDEIANPTTDAVEDIHAETIEPMDRSPTPVAARPKTPPKILVVDDNRYTTSALKRRLTQYGFEAITASGGREAFWLALRERPDAIVTDYDMPDGDGAQLLNLLKDEVQTKSIPAVVLTGWTHNGQKDLALERDLCGRCGAVAVVTKSQGLGAVLKELKRYLNYPV